MLSVTLIPMFLGILLYGVYLFVGTHTNEKYPHLRRDEDEVFEKLENISRQNNLGKPFTYAQKERFRQAYAKCAGKQVTTVIAEQLCCSEKSAKKIINDVMIEKRKINSGDIITFEDVMTAVYNDRILNKGGDKMSALFSIVEGAVISSTQRSLIYFILLLAFLVLVGTSTTLFHYFNCEEFPEAAGGTDSYLRKDFSIDCNSQRYRDWTPYAVIMILIYPIGIPLTFWVLLMEHRNILRDPINLQKEKAINNINIGHVTFLIESYKPEYYYFEVIECFRRLALASAIGLFSDDSPVPVALAVVISFGFSVLFSHVKPYKEYEDNLLAEILSCSLVLLFLSALFIKQDVTDLEGDEEEVYAFILIVVLFAGPCAVAWFFLNETYGMFMELIFAAKKKPNARTVARMTQLELRAQEVTNNAGVQADEGSNMFLIGNRYSKAAFMLDRSGSMSSSVPGVTRYMSRFDAVKMHLLALLEGKSDDFEFSVQLFDTSIIRFNSGILQKNTSANS